jgi:enoyl-CoA hydratase
MSLPDALRRETQLGTEVLRSGETLRGAQRFAGGAGRHGSFEN